MKYKVGDRVRIKSLDWYNKNKNKVGDVPCGDRVFDNYMSVFCGCVVTICGVCPYGYGIREDIHCRTWTDEMIEGLVEEEMTLDKAGQITDFEYEGLAYTLPDGYQFVDENGNVINATKIVLEKKNKEYPKTFIDVLDFWHPDRHLEDDYQRGYKKDIIEKFQDLLYARDAYWKIAGKEMGLGKPWEPDWEDNTPKFSIRVVENMLSNITQTSVSYVLTFPTEEMRDAFKENFDPDIEFCKEFL